MVHDNISVTLNHYNDSNDNKRLILDIGKDKESFEPILKNMEMMPGSQTSWKLVPQGRSLIAEGPGSHSTLWIVRTTSEPKSCDHRFSSRECMYRCSLIN